MTTISEATAAPTMITLGGKEYRLSPIRDNDLGELERWIQDRHIEITKRNIGGLPDSIACDLMRSACAEARKLQITDKAVIENLSTSIEGVAKLLELQLRREHPEITHAGAIALITSPENMDAAILTMGTMLADGNEEQKKTASVQSQSVTSTDSSQTDTTGGRKS